MDNEIVKIDSRLDAALSEQPAETVRLIVQEYQIAYDKQTFVAALAAKLVVSRGRAQK